MFVTHMRLRFDVYLIQPKLYDLDRILTKIGLIAYPLSYLIVTVNDDVAGVMSGENNFAAREEMMNRGQNERQNHGH
jgi:hypothetical protein